MNEPQEVKVTEEHTEVVRAAVLAGFALGRTFGMTVDTQAKRDALTTIAVERVARDESQPVEVRAYAMAVLQVILERRPSVESIAEEPEVGYICKRCATPSPAGIGYPSAAPDAVAMSPTIQSCECGYSRVEAQSGEVTP